MVVSGQKSNDPQAASKYEQQLRLTTKTLPSAQPSLDLILLGLGEDGHTASLFPEASILRDHQRVIAATQSPKDPPNRLTITVGVCPSNAALLRQTICRHLCRSRSQEILDVLQGIRLRFFGTCGLASASSSLSLATKDYSDRFPAVINKVSMILFAVTGTGKAWVVRDILDPKTEAEEGGVIWFLDRAAAAELPIL